MMKRLSVIVLLFATMPAMSQDKDSQETEILKAARQRMTSLNDVWFHDGEFLPVIQSQSVLAELNPHDEETWSNLEWMFQNVERPDEQWFICRRFAILNPTYADGKYYEAKLFYMKKLYARVPALLEPTLKMTPGPDANTFRFLAHSYDKLGYFQDAVRVWDEYIKKYPNDPQAKKNRESIAKKIK